MYHTYGGDDDRPYAVIRDRSEVWGIASRRFREWLRGCYFKHVGKGVNSNSVRDAIETISAKAQFSGDKRKVFLRTAEANGKLYIDMTDDGWRVIEIDRDGWRVLDHSPVMFTRRGTPAPLPVPERGGSLSELWPFLNVPEKYKPLVAGWQLAALYPSGPYPYPPTSRGGRHGQDYRCAHTPVLMRSGYGAAADANTR